MQNLQSYVMNLSRRIKNLLKFILRLNPVEVPPPSKDKGSKVLANSVFIPIVLQSIDRNPLLPLSGNSMRPFLVHKRDKAILAPVRQVKVGDPVLAEIEKGRYVLHRVVAIEGTDITLRGDGNIMTENCKLKDVRASVMGFYRKGRKTPDMVTSLRWRLYSMVWMRTLPVRKYLLLLHHLFFRSLKKL